MANLVVHFEIHGSEPLRLVDFYSELLGWRFARWGDMPLLDPDNNVFGLISAVMSDGTTGMGGGA